MNQYITGSVIRDLREKNNMTQLEVADRLMVSDKTVSKWETGKGYPDITMLEDIAKLFQISVMELISGEPVSNKNVAGNMFKSCFYVCPICGNIIHSMGEAVISCHGISLPMLEAEESDENHQLKIEKIEDEFYITTDHEMTKGHYISFIAAAGPDKLEMVKLYPEGNAEVRLKLRAVRFLYYYCNKDGLFRIPVNSRKMK